MINKSFSLFLFITVMALQSSFGGHFEVLFADVELDNQTPLNLALSESTLNSNFSDTDVDTGIAIKYGVSDGWSIAYSRFNANSFAIASDGSFSESVTEKLNFQDIMLEYSFEKALSERLFYIASLGFGVAWADYKINSYVSDEELVDSINLSANDRVSIFSAGFGIGYNLNKNTDLLLHYKYSNVREIDLSDMGLPNWDMDFETTNVGVRIKF